MKYCKNCGAENNDENQFCFNCRFDSFNELPPIPPPVIPNPMQNPNMMMNPMPMYQQPAPKPKKPLTIFDLFAILGFVAAIVGMFSASIILHPVSAIASIVGFVGQSRFKALSIAGFVIAIVGGIVFTVITLYRAGYIPEWITDGAFH